MRHHRESVVFIESEIQRVFGDNATVNLIGHSIGGALALYVALGCLRDRIRKIVTIATAFSGGVANPTLYKAALRWTGISERNYYEHREAVHEISDKIVNIAASSDSNAPFSRCVIPGSKGYNLDVSELFPDEHICHSRIVASTRVLALIHEHLST
jgi:pimeloyl-ACP methyl ester carboxylesterase